MNANAIVLTPEQFEELKYSFRAELLNEVKNSQQTVGAYSPEWIDIRHALEAKMRSDYNNGCGQWYQNQQGLYAAFRLAFQKDSIRALRGVEQGKLKQFYDDLFVLIDKYRTDNEKGAMK